MYNITHLKNVISFKKIIKSNVFIIFICLLSIDILVSSYHYFYSLRLFSYWDIGGQVKVFLYIANYLIQILIFVLLLTSSNRIIRYLSYFSLFFTFSVFLTYYLINGYGFTSNEAMVAVLDFDFLGAAFSNFSTSIYKSVLITASAIIILYYVSYERYNIINNKILLLISSLLITVYIVGGTYSVSDRLFFVPFKVIFNSYNALQAPMYSGIKREVERSVGKSKVDKIVFVVDESIVGDKLSLNGYKENTTPFLKSIENNIFNYGIASSGANCSGISNTLLRTGIMVNMLPDKKQLSMHGPNIWAYAKKAGYYTVFIDGQNTKNTLQNFMNKHDLNTIDKYYQIEKCCKSKYYDNDNKMINIMKEELKKHKKIFIYINKVGAHFPYENTYPQDEKIFKPTLSIDEAPSLAKKYHMLNSYYNSLRWGVDSWWKNITVKLKGINAVFIYTSDHGQNLFDNSSRSTHCSSKPLSNEANVPLFIFPFGNTKDIIEEYSKENHINNMNKTSHFNIFPTILFLEGYNLNSNELSLFDNLGKEKQYFFSGDIWNRAQSVRKNNFHYENLNMDK